jgi:hypothetical protein
MPSLIDKAKAEQKRPFRNKVVIQRPAIIFDMNAGKIVKNKRDHQVEHRGVIPMSTSGLVRPEGFAKISKGKKTNPATKKADSKVKPVVKGKGKK